MLELRPNCENCDKLLPPDALDARICSFECTFCAACVAGVLQDVCPNCGGGFTVRPVRPARDWQGGNFLGTYPAATRRKHRPVDAKAHAALVARISPVPPHQR